ncbi:MAG: bifunctional 3-demethylubiquinol 3-O-methyltransferase/2-polyprenyl-6-hydroxyphenol methylase [Candidatus Pelagibacter sp.]|nr:bifunctional 3-demethylubiquinol 3-O-methyltransferase/2-polyprenyl-6-hydroxyphenol methylase [Candidatus Pelagibacter sp.]|tara:strand:- start:589 stop:1314 length:726 start_codon:yes stop_codon:yes gene_type:complete
MTTINKKEIQKFSNLADEWWDVNGKFKPLHIFNPTRIDYIVEKITDHFSLDRNKRLNLKSLKILDIGCGGGLVSEPMSRLGANVTGIDASEKNINVARLHANRSKLKINYLNTSPENLKVKEKFDVILNLEIVEHVDNLDLYIKSCSDLLKPQGLIFTATLNRTFESYIKAILGAEYVLRWLPIGTHDWNKFIKPSELKEKLERYHFKVSDVKGVVYNIFSGSWTRSNNCSVNYVVTAIKS